ncbi:MAG TPA: LysR family transcriptional regulator, partial [Burkholderiales bacterium]
MDQWTALVTVVESGSYAKAGEVLHKSQSTLTYAIQRLEELLGLKVFEIRGRKAVLTPAGEVLYRRGRALV